MSRPESPIKGNLPDDDMIKKLKALLIKEKRINKENSKIINDLKADNDQKNVENNLLIAQIQRLSKNMGDMDVSETNYKIKVDELKTSLNALQQTLDCVKAVEEKRKEEENIFRSNVDEFMTKLKSSLTILIKEHREIILNKGDLNYLNNLDYKQDDILELVDNIKEGIKSHMEGFNILQNGLEKMTLKCNQMETMISSKDEQTEILSAYQKKILNASTELDQREEQIRRLEELIEDNRNISRALETERDQLQNDLVDLRQRHEEKEGYLIEEYREAQQSLENYRIFTDKQSAEKANEIERLRKCLNDYQGVTQEQFMTECRLCRDVESLFNKLKIGIDVNSGTENYEELVDAVIVKYTGVNKILNEHIERLNKNESRCHQELEHMAEKVKYIEKLLTEKSINNNQIEGQNYEEIFEDLNSKLLEKEEIIFTLHNELEQTIIIIQQIKNVLELNDTSRIINSIHEIISLNKELTNAIGLCKSSLAEQRSRYENMLEEKDNYANNLAVKLTEAGKHVNHNDLMNLEMAEIDKTLISLNNQVSTKSGIISELELTLKSKETFINDMTKEIQSAQKQNQQLDDRNNKMKQMLVKIKRELTDCKSSNLILQENENLRTNEVEALNAQLEDIKVTLSEAINDKEKLQERYNSFSRKMESISKTREITIASLRSQTEATLQNNRSLQQEFDQYKVKVQTAFSSKIRPSAMFSDFMTLPSNDQSSDEDANSKSFRKQINDLEMNIDDLKMDLREKEEKIFSLQSDLDLMRWDNDKLSEKLKTNIKENNDLTVKMQQISEQLQNDTKLQQISQTDTLQRFTSEKEKLNQIHQKQIESIRSIYDLEIETLTQKIEAKEIEKVKLQEEIWECREQLKTADHKLVQIKNHDNDQSHPSMLDMWTQNLRPPLSQERQQGEGMEMINDTENVMSLGTNKIWSPKQYNGKSTVYNNQSFVPLDQLLSSHSEDDQKLSDDMISNLKIETSSYRKKNEYLTELLNDNEATVARLTEQALLLKAEIRRLENNQEREQTLEDKASREYLKNVIIKFLHYDTKSDERSQLVPVLVTLLSLDSIEKELLMKFCKLCSYSKKEGEGWSSYFGWAGMS